MKFFLFIFMIIAVPVDASEFNKVLTANTIQVLAQDWGQTREFRQNRPDMVEINKILGPRPTIAKVDKYFAAVIAAYLIESLNAPDWISIPVTIVVFTIETKVIIQNSSQNVRPDYDRLNPRSIVVTFTTPI